jgi:plasmid stabilization system protein ParE
VTLRYAFSPRAVRQLHAAKTWWLAHREKAPDAFDDDIAEQVERLRTDPFLGSPVHRARSSGIRRVVLSRIRYYLYCRVEGDLLVLVALWHTSRRPPKL